MKQRALILHGPKKDKFTNLKELIFCEDYQSTSKGITQHPTSQKPTVKAGSSSCLMVYDYIEHDLMGLIRRKIKFSASQIKYILKEILEAVETLHSEHIEHGHLKSIFFLTKHQTST